jgi:hypothetical protein
LAALLSRALDQAGDARAATFLADYRHTLTANLLRSTRAVRVADALASAGIKAVLLKGAAFLARFPAYDPGLRPMSDVDVLVSPAEFERAVGVLRAHGLAPAFARYDVSAAAAPGRLFVLRGGALDLEIDLHSRVAQWPLHTRTAASTLERSEPAGSWLVPSLPDAIAGVAIHRASHAFVWSGLDLVDLRHLVDSLGDPEWAACVEHLDGLGALAPTYATYRQALYTLGDPRAADPDRLASLARRLGVVRRRWLGTLAPEDGAIRPRVSQDRPLTRNLVIHPVVTGSVVRPLAAAVVYLPLRVADEWKHAGGQGRSLGRRLAAVWRHVTGGARAQELKT